MADEFEDPDPLGLNAAPDFDFDGDFDDGQDRARIINTAALATYACGGFGALILILYFFGTPGTPPAPAPAHVRIQAPVREEPKPYAPKRVTLSDAVNRIVVPHGFGVQDVDHFFTDTQFVKSMPSTERPWDEALEDLLKPYQLEYKLDSGVVYIGKDFIECMQLTGMSASTLGSPMFSGRARCDEVKYKAKHPDPLPTDPFWRCIKDPAATEHGAPESTARYTYCNIPRNSDVYSPPGSVVHYNDVLAPYKDGAQKGASTTSTSADPLQKYSQCLVPVLHTEFRFPPEGGVIIRTESNAMYFVKTYLPGCQEATEIGKIIRER